MKHFNVMKTKSKIRNKNRNPRFPLTKVTRLASNNLVLQINNNNDRHKMKSIEKLGTNADFFISLCFRINSM